MVIGRCAAAGDVSGPAAKIRAAAEVKPAKKRFSLMKTPEWIEKWSERRSLTYAAMLDGPKQKISRQNVAKQEMPGCGVRHGAAMKNAELPLDKSKNKFVVRKIFLACSGEPCILRLRTLHRRVRVSVARGGR